MVAIQDSSININFAKRNAKKKIKKKKVEIQPYFDYVMMSVLISLG